MGPPASLIGGAMGPLTSPIGGAFQPLGARLLESGPLAETLSIITILQRSALIMERLFKRTEELAMVSAHV
jgi:hypothetical protein